MTALQRIEKLQDATLLAVETSHRLTLGALRATTSAFDLVQLDLSRFRFGDQLPSVSEWVESSFAFAGRVLEVQHALVTGLLGLVVPPPAPPVVSVEPRLRRSDTPVQARRPLP